MKLTDLTAQQVFTLMVLAIRRGEDPARQFYAYDADTDGMTYSQLADEGRVPSLYAGLISAIEYVYDAHTDVESGLRSYAASHQLEYTPSTP